MVRDDCYYYDYDEDDYNEENVDMSFGDTYKLYEIPRESKIEVDMNGYPAVITFHRLDGMYSFCTTEKDIVVHLYACSELEKVGEKHYRLLG